MTHPSPSVRRLAESAMMAGMGTASSGRGFVGLDVGTGGVRGAVLDENMVVIGREAVRLPPGRRTDDGGHRLDEAVIHNAAARVIEAACARIGTRPAALAVSGTAGTLCFRDQAGERAAAPVAYDDGRFGSGTSRVEAWARLVPNAVRVIPMADAVLEALGAPPGRTDWNNALKLGWDPRALTWPEGAHLLSGGFLPGPVPSGTIAGRAVGPAALRGASLVRGTTDGCAMQAAFGPLQSGDWSIGLGTTLIWKTVLPAEMAATCPGLPPGAYAHRLGQDLWLPGGASNSGGGVLEALEPGANLRRRDAESTSPSGLAAYPLGRPGERFPVPDPGFAGFGLPPSDDPRLHAAILEGVAFVMRLGIHQLVAVGLPQPVRLRITGGGARSSTWMDIVASVLKRPVIAAPDADPALGTALIAAAGALGAPIASIEAGPGSQGRLSTHHPRHQLSDELDEAYEAFTARLPSNP